MTFATKAPALTYHGDPAIKARTTPTLTSRATDAITASAMARLSAPMPNRIRHYSNSNVDFIADVLRDAELRIPPAPEGVCNGRAFHDWMVASGFRVVTALNPAALNPIPPRDLIRDARPGDIVSCRAGVGEKAAVCVGRGEFITGVGGRVGRSDLNSYDWYSATTYRPVRTGARA